ncbi:MAG: NAD(P)H-dependent oxidoreductase [Acidobacteriota bacterium]|nr:MAG: NAD(P)H-dependent oxidoreductase [Acidobacteriota bacterium]
MRDSKVNIPILLGTPRQERQSEHVANWVLLKAKERGDIETRLFDVRDFVFPSEGYGQELKDSYPEWRDAIIGADGLIVITPEYNHGYPGSLKAVIDLLLREYIHKAVGIVGVSAGPWGGTRVIEAMVPMVRELGLAVTFTDLNFPKVADKFDEAGNLLDDAYHKRAEGFFDELVWMARTLKWGRENLPSKYH